MNLEQRAQTHAALGDSRRLHIVDQLALGDHTVAELAEASGLSGNLLAHHLDVLQSAGLVERRVSEGDQRRRYVSLRWANLPDSVGEPDSNVFGRVAFICTHNSARSQFAAALWETRTGSPAESAGSDPSPAVHPDAIRIAEEFGVDLAGSRPGGYELLSSSPDLIISVCDRARESEFPDARRHLHWSVPDPVRVGTASAFRSAFTEIVERVEHLAGQAGTVA